MMLRTNPSLLRFIERLYAAQPKRDHIALKNYAAGDLLFAQGDAACKVLVVKSGICKCFFTEENGKDYILEFMGEGEIFGEIEAIREDNCLCNVASVTDVFAYQLSLPFFQTLLHDEPDFSKLVLRELADRLVNTSSRASFQQLYTVRHALARLRDLQRRQDIELPKEDVAAYLGITLRSLNRLLREM